MAHLCKADEHEVPSMDISCVELCRALNLQQMGIQVVENMSCFRKNYVIPS